MLSANRISGAADLVSIRSTNDTETLDEMTDRGWERDEVRTAALENPHSFFSQSPNLDYEP